jgi:hypothetical protein
MMVTMIAIIIGITIKTPGMSAAITMTIAADRRNQGATHPMTAAEAYGAFADPLLPHL